MLEADGADVVCWLVITATLLHEVIKALASCVHAGAIIQNHTEATAGAQSQAQAASLPRAVYRLCSLLAGAPSLLQVYAVHVDCVGHSDWSNVRLHSYANR